MRVYRLEGQDTGALATIEAPSEDVARSIGGQRMHEPVHAEEMRFRLYTTYTPPYKQMYVDYFKGTLQDDVDLDAKYVDTPNDGRFGTQYFRSLHMEMYQGAVEYMRAHRGELLFLTGVDVQFFRPFTPVAANRLLHHDILFQRDSKDSPVINDGVVFCRATDLVIDLYERCIAKITENDELMLLDVMRRELSNPYPAHKNPRWCLLDQRFFSKLQGDPPADIILHHACNCPKRKKTTTAHEKMKYMDEVRVAVGATPIARTLS